MKCIIPTIRPPNITKFLFIYLFIYFMNLKSKKVLILCVTCKMQRRNEDNFKINFLKILHYYFHVTFFLFGKKSQFIVVK